MKRYGNFHIHKLTKHRQSGKIFFSTWSIFFNPLKISQKLQLSATLGEIHERRTNVFNSFLLLTLTNINCRIFCKNLECELLLRKMII